MSAVADTSVFDLVATGAPAGPHAPAGPVDWPATKRAVYARLDVAAEFAALGVAFTAPHAAASGWRECRAVGRPDETPSAAVHLGLALYTDLGGGGKPMDLVQFALTHGEGRHHRWIDALRHYAERAGVPLPRPEFRSHGRIADGHHDYRTAAGAVAYRIFRAILPGGDKTFSARPPDGKGGWKSGSGAMDGVEPLPYRLPELLASAADGETVWVVEGERKADRLAAEGLVATTNHGGGKATSRTWPKFAASFLGRDVVVLPDNDAVGREHARGVCRILAPVARSVRLLPLPGLARAGDVLDWLEAGNTVEDLGRLAHAAPAFDPAAEPEAAADDDPARDATVADLRPLMLDASWFWPGWVPTAALTLLASEAGTGKTRFCMDLHRRLMHGLHWPDGTATPLVDNPRVLWVPADGQYQELCDIAAEFGIPDELILLNAPLSDPFGGTTLETAEELVDLDARIGRVRPTLVFIDTITNTGDFKSQDTSDAKRQYKPLQDLATRHRVPILCVTHLNTGGKVLGRRATEKVRVVIQMSCPDPDGQPTRRKLWVEKSKAVRPPPLGVTMGTHGNEYDVSPPKAPEAERIGGATRGPAPVKTRECMDWLAIRLGMGPVRVKHVIDDAETAGHAKGTLYKARDALRITQEEVDGYKFWSLPAGANGHAPDVPF